MAYIGNQPGTGVRSRFIYTATASQTTFSGADNNSKTLKYADSAYVDVFLNGVCLVPGTDYTASTKTSIVLTQAASLNDTLEVVAYDIASMSDMSASNGGTFQADVTFAAGADIITATAGTNNTRFGLDAGSSIESGGVQNTAVGSEALKSATTADNNVAVGQQALYTTTTGGNNVGLGRQALYLNTTGANNVAVGYEALEANTTASNNTAMGYQAGKSVTTGTNNVLIGGLAGDALTDADANVAIGKSALSADTLGSKSIAIGLGTLQSQNFTSATDSHNTAVGHGVGASVTTGTHNTLIGSESGDALTVGGHNVAMGYEALSTDTQGSHSTAIGRRALKTQNFASATDSHNTAIGNNAGLSVTTGLNNTIVGSNAGDAITTSASNVAIGKSALSAETSSNGNVAVGEGALGEQNVGGSGDSRNTAVGLLAGGSITTGEKNTLVGALCADSMQTNTEMTAIGYNLAATSQTGRAREILIGSNGTGGGSNTARFCTSSGVLTIDIDGSDTSWAAASDLRLKKDVADSTVGLAFIKDLRPITFKWNAKNAIEDSLPQYDADSSDPVFGEGKAHHGFIAQEIKAVIDAHSDIVNGHNIWKEDPDGTQQVAPSALVPMLVKAIQELSAKNDALEARIVTLEG